MLPPVFQTLKASAAVKAIVGSNPPRIWRHGSVPKNVVTPLTDPFITWLLIAGVPNNNLSDPVDVDQMSVQLDCWHTTDQGVEALCAAARDAIELRWTITNFLLDERDPETSLYRMAFQFDAFNGRSS